MTSYAVPVHFQVRFHMMITMRLQADGTVYYRAPPAQAALEITQAGGILGGLFKGAYKLDIVPQGWPYAYRVVGVDHSKSGTTSVLVLRSVPRAEPSDITQVLFTLTSPALEPVSAVWLYRDTSSIHLTLVNRRVGDYTMPQRATISVDKSRYRLDADATYGEYALNVPVPDSVFTSAK